MSGDVEATLAEHFYDDHACRCTCGVLMAWNKHTAHVAAVLAPVVAEQVEQALEAAAQRVEAKRRRVLDAHPRDSLRNEYTAALEQAARIVRAGGRP